MDNSQVSIVVSSCDGYKDLWPLFWGFAEKNGYLGVAFYLVTDKPTDNCSPRFPAIYPPSPLEFSERFLFALEKIDSEYILVLLDDYMLMPNPNPYYLAEMVQKMKTYGLDFLRLTKGPKIAKGRKLAPKLWSLNLKRPYDADVHPFLIKKTLLKSILQMAGSDNIRLFEISFSKRLYESGASCAYSSDSFPFREAVVGGRFFRSAYSMVQKSGFYNGSRIKQTCGSDMSFHWMLLLRYLLPIWVQDFIKRGKRKKGMVFVSDAGVFMPKSKI